ncbi:MAG: hypothetical protein O7G84_19385 [Gammaproteobacteria bacterium]|nr:hypothetical protein [Gammaproteobacteria bacterium]
MRLMIKAQPSPAAASEQSRGTRGGMARYAPINVLRAQARAGMGEINAFQLEMQRMQRTTSETAELPRIVHEIGDITRGLGLAKADETTIQRVVSQTNTEFTPKSQTQRLFLARGMLGDLLRSMTQVPGDARQEIAKRATAWWQKQGPTSLDRSMRVGISYARDMNKAGAVARWITVSGARIPIGADGKMMGKTGEKLMLHREKKASGGDYSRDVASAVRSISRMPGTGGGMTTAKRVGVLMATGALQARKALKEAHGQGLVDYHPETKSWSLTAKGKKLGAMRKATIVFPLSRVAPDMV